MKLSFFRAIGFVLTFLLIGSKFSEATEPSPKINGYDLTKPDKVIVLPPILNEVSGVTKIDNNTVACVQDEKGILFIYDVTKNEIINQFSFHIDGDYEGIARVEKTMYVLRSDGTLFEIENYSVPGSRLKSYVTGIPANNNEGLCYDKKNNRLLIACKTLAEKGKENKDKRLIYGFDLATKKLSTQPVFSFDLATIRDFAIKKEMDLPAKTKKKGNINEPLIRFRTSAIDIHPLTGKLFLLSAADHMLFIFDQKGNTEHIEALNEDVFNKSEGITFFDNGDMLITNEAQEKKPTLLRFNHRE